MTKKGKRAKITDIGRTLITARALEYPRIPRTELAVRLQSELKGNEQDVPELEVLERKISNIRSHEGDDPQDKPWSLATLDNPDYSIPPEAVPAVLKVWKLSVEKGLTFTIRGAKWVSRLSAVEQDVELLSVIAGHYALHERVADLDGSPFNSNALDKKLMGLPLNWYEDMMLKMYPEFVLKKLEEKSAKKRKGEKRGYDHERPHKVAV